MTTISDELYGRITALLRTLVSACKCCCRPKSACWDCDLRLVGYLMERLDNERVRRVPDRDARFDEILKEFREAGRPLMSREIDPGKRLFARGLKHWTLRRMVTLGLLKIVKEQDRNTLFGLGPNAEAYEKRRRK